MNDIFKSSEEGFNFFVALIVLALFGYLGFGFNGSDMNALKPSGNNSNSTHGAHSTYAQYLKSSLGSSHKKNNNHTQSITEFLDSDGDTIEDGFDLCPKDYGKTSTGCPARDTDPGNDQPIFDDMIMNLK